MALRSGDWNRIAVRAGHSPPGGGRRAPLVVSVLAWLLALAVLACLIRLSLFGRVGYRTLDLGVLPGGAVRRVDAPFAVRSPFLWTPARPALT